MPLTYKAEGRISSSKMLDDKLVLVLNVGKKLEQFVCTDTTVIGQIKAQTVNFREEFKIKVAYTIMKKGGKHITELINVW
jgi:hypothetical protein